MEADRKNIRDDMERKERSIEVERNVSSRADYEIEL